MLIAPSAPTILRRTVALSANAGRIEPHLACRRAFFDGDYMFPVVAEVVGVDEAGDAGFQQAVQGQPIFIGAVVGSVAIAVLQATDIEGMEMVIMPTHRGLDRLMQVSQRHLAKHEEAAPDRRSRAAQRHLQADDALAATSLRLDGLGHDPAPSRSDASPPPSFARRFARRQAGYRATGSGCPSRVRRMAGRIGSRVVERSRRRT